MEDYRRCPNCKELSQDLFGSKIYQDKDKEEILNLCHKICPHCNNILVWIKFMEVEIIDYKNGHTDTKGGKVLRDMYIYPRVTNRNTVPQEVPKEFSQDYLEACLVLSDSPKASAALSRRCLQNILRKKGNVKHSVLSNEIDEIISTGNLHSKITDLLHIVRKLGNIAAHPIDNIVSGTIMDIEENEAECCLEVIESLYDHYFVQPSKNNERLENMRKSGKIKLP